MSMKARRGAHTPPSVDAERGAALVELSIVAMLVLALGFGIVEIGSGWSDRQKVTQAARSGARVASQLGIANEADLFTVRAIEGALGDLRGAVTRMVIYRADGADGAMPAVCETAAPPGVGGRCSVYDVSDFATYAAWSQGSWPPSARDNTIRGADYIGVRVEVSRPTFTGFIGSTTFDISDTVTMRVEPEAGS